MDEKVKRQFEDELLEAAVGERANAEPRAGLEQRILAGIEARWRAPAFPRWVWVFAAGAAVLAVVVVIVLHRPVASVHSVPPPVTAGRVQPILPVAAGPGMRKIPPPAANAITVRPSTFPSPRPLSQQEKLLLAYVHKARLEEAGAGAAQPTDDDLKIPKLEVAALDIKPPEGSDESPDK